MKTITRIAITVALAVGLSTTVNHMTKNDNVLKDLECKSKIMKASPSIVTICELGEGGEVRMFTTPLNKESE